MKMHKDALRRGTGTPSHPDLERRLVDGLESMELRSSPGQRADLIAYLGLMAKWNDVYNLTSVRTVADMLVVHVLDSLAILPLVDRVAPGSMLDVGSGAGLPGIPLAILRPDLRVHSVDAVAKKIGFQLQAKAALKLKNFTPVHRRVEALTLAEMPELIVSRAYAELATMLTSIAHLTTSSTRVLAMKGARPDAELSVLPAPWQLQDVVTLDVPFLGAQRCAVLLERTA